MSLIELAQKTMSHAYAPYSQFKVGCAVKSQSGKTFVGCNIENSSYGATVCAERVAIFAMVASGETALKELTLVSSSKDPVVPCGMCLQVISEFGSECELTCFSNDGKTSKKFSLKDLLPHGFSKKSLKS